MNDHLTPWEKSFERYFHNLEELFPQPQKPKAYLLLVDDSHSKRLHLSIGLKQRGYHVIKTHDGVEAIQQLEKNHDFDAILLDMILPKINGFKTTKYIRKKLEYKKPIIGYSSHSSPEAIQEGKKAGLSEYIHFNYHPTILYEVVHKWLSISEESF